MSKRWPALLSRAQAANYLGVGESFIDRMRAREDIHPVRIGERVELKLRRVDLDRCIEDLPEAQLEFE